MSTSPSGPPINPFPPQPQVPAAVPEYEVPPPAGDDGPVPEDE